MNAEAFRREYPTDAHFSAYSVPSLERRLDTNAPAKLVEMGLPGVTMSLSYVEQMAARGIDRTTYIGVVVWGDDFFYGVSLVSDIPDLIPATWIGDVLARAREFSAAGDLPILHLKDGRLLLERRPVSRLNSRGGKG